MTAKWLDLTSDQPYSISIRIDEDGRGGIWVIPRYEPLPEILSLTFGEMLYQLRATLDGCIYASAICESGQDPPPDEDALEFPITATPEQFKNAGRHIRPLPEKLKGLIETIQPYNASKLSPSLQSLAHGLTVLNHWARIDRHRRLHLMGSWASRANPKLRHGDDIRVVSVTGLSEGFLGDETQIATFELEGWKPGAHIEANPDFSIGIAVNESPPPTEPGDNIGRRSADMISAVAAILELFETGFEKGSFKGS